MGYWKSTVVPKFKKLFEKNSIKKAAAAEACKAFDESKVRRRFYIYRITVWLFVFYICELISELKRAQEDYSKEFEAKKAELEAKVLEIYEAASAEVKVIELFT